MTTPSSNMSPGLPTKLLERIRKLLAQAEHAGTPQNEAEAFSAQAARLMAKYNVDRAVIDMLSSGPGDGIERRVIGMPVKPGTSQLLPHSVYSAGLCCGIAEELGAKSLIHGTPRTTSRVVVYGTPSVCDTVELLFRSLLLQRAHAMIAAERAPIEGMPTGLMRRSFLAGYTWGVRTLIAQQQAAAQAESSFSSASTELAVRSMTERAEAAIDADHPDIETRTTKAELDQGAMRLGWQAGLEAAVVTGGELS